MTEEEKCFEAQKYFAFKVMDYTSNSFHAFESKALESIEYYMLKCLETYEEIQISVAGDKLSKAYKALLIGLNTLLKIHPFGTIAYYKNDFSQLKKILPTNDGSSNENTKIQDKNHMDISIFMSIRSLYKKYKNAPICSQYVHVLLNEKTFKIVDDTIEFLISDLLYRGFSFYHIKTWFTSTYAQNPDFFAALSKKDISGFVKKIGEFDLHTKPFSVGIKYTVKHDCRERLFEFLKRKFSLTQEVTDEHIKKCGDWGLDKNIYTYYVFQEIDAIDVHKAIQIAEQNFDAAIMTFFIVSLPTTMKISKEKICVAGSDSLDEYNSLQIKNATDMLWVDGKERDQMITYMELSLSPTCEMDTIGRVITTIKNAKELDAQNQFLNSWSALEYLLYAYPRNSIIEKVREIIPKASALYCIKEKLNYFWMRLNHFCKSAKNIDCVNTIRLSNECTKEKSEYEYNTKKLLSFFEDEVWETAVLVWCIIDI